MSDDKPDPLKKLYNRRTKLTASLSQIDARIQATEAARKNENANAIPAAKSLPGLWRSNMRPIATMTNLP